MMRPNLQSRAIGALIIGASCIGLAPILVRLSELPPTATAFHRMLLALPLFALWIVLRNGNSPDPTPVPSLARRLGLVVLSGTLFAADLAIWHWAIVFTSVANATLLANISPVFVGIAARIVFGERLTGTLLIGMAIAFSGAAVLARASLDLDILHLYGDALALTTALLYAGYLVTIKVLRQWLNTGVLMGLSSAVSCLVLFLLSVVLGEALAPPSLYGWTVLLALAWISQVLGQGLIAFGLAHLPATFSAVSLLVQPVVAAGLAWLILWEPLAGWQAVGGLIVLVGIILAHRGSTG